MITLHHLANSRSYRVIWLLEELNLPYEIKKYDRDPKTFSAPEELKRIFPIGHFPVIVDDTTDGQVVVAESGAIVEYIIDRYGEKMKPKARFSNEGMSYRYYMHYAEGTFMPYLVQLLVFSLLPRRSPFFIRWLVRFVSKRVIKSYLYPNIHAQLEILNNDLEGKTWFCGDELSGADIMLSFPVEGALRIKGNEDKRGNLHRFINQIKGRAAWKRAEEKGGKLEFRFY